MVDTLYRIGIVGAGTISIDRPPELSGTPLKHETNLASHVGSLGLSPRAELAALCDIRPEALEQFSEVWGDRWPDTRTYTDHRQMLADGNLDVVVVATSDHMHADIVVDAGGAGVKGVLCEKPLATTLEDADRMIQACERSGVVFTVDHTYRYRKSYHAIRQAVRAGAIGPVSYVITTMRGPRAMLFRNGTHMIDGLVFFAESSPAQVFARLEDGFDDWDRYKGDGGKLPQFDPGATGFVLFENGVRAVYAGEKQSAVGSGYELWGPDGRITYDQATALVTLHTLDEASGAMVSRPLETGDHQVHSINAAYEEMFDLIERGGESVSSAREARKTLQILLGFLKSHQQGGKLVDVPT